MVRKGLNFALLALVMVGCAVSEPAPTPAVPVLPTLVDVKLIPISPLPTPALPTEKEVKQPEPQPSPTFPADEALSRAVKRAVADLAKRLGIPESEIEVVSASWEEMPIQDVECGRPEGKITLPAFVMGIEVVLYAQGKTYVYRGRGEMLNLCFQEGEEPEAVVLEKVKALFSDFPPEEVKFLKVERVIWPDTSLGCPEPGKVYAQVLVPGYRIIAEVGGRKVEVHTDLKGRAVICGPIVR